MPKDNKIGLTAERPSLGTVQQNISDLVDKEKIRNKAVRISVNISEDQHFNLKYFAMINKKTLASVLQDYISTIPAAPKKD
jgi:4-hydroxy-3-methylbut-2-en-1-yl diphosphate synthase IspG/GcpE